MKLTVLLLIAVAFSSATGAEPIPITSPAKDLAAWLREGLFEEEAARDTAKAAAAYASLLTEYDRQRAFAATALFRLAEIRAQEGKKDEAIALHNRLLQEFPGDQKLVALSRSRLEALAPGTKFPASGSPAIAGQEQLTTKEAEEIVKAREMIKNSPDLLNAPDKDGSAPLVRAAVSGWVTVGTFLLDNGALPDGLPHTWVPLHWAAKAGHKRMAELLLSRGADVNAKDDNGWTALHAAVNFDRMEVVRVLIKAGAKPNVVVNNSINTYDASECTPLLIAAIKDRAAIAELLFEAGADANLANPASGITPLMRACDSQRPAMVALLLAKGANANAEAMNGRTALHFAAEQGNVEIAQKLLEAGAKPDESDTNGVTPLLLAVTRSIPLAQLLLTKNVRTDVLDSERRTLWGASLFGVTNSAATVQSGGRKGTSVDQLPALWQSFLEHGMDINALDGEGGTLLHYACAYELIPLDLVAWLLAHGADPTIRNRGGALPFSNAQAVRVRDLERRFVLPELAKKKAVTVLVRWPGLESADPIVQGDDAAPPSYGQVRDKILNRNTSLTDTAPITVFRADEKGKIVEVAHFTLDRQKAEPDTNFEMRWGDIVLVGDYGNFGGVVRRPPGVLPLPGRVRVINPPQPATPQ